MYQISKEKTGKRIRKLLTMHGITVRDLQEALGLESQQAIYKWMNGRALPSVDNLAALSGLLRTPMDEIIVYEVGDVEGRRQWEKDHPPIFIGQWVTSPNPLKRTSGKRLRHFLEYTVEECRRTALEIDPSFRSDANGRAATRADRQR